MRVPPRRPEIKFVRELGSGSFGKADLVILRTYFYDQLLVRKEIDMPKLSDDVKKLCL